MVEQAIDELLRNETLAIIASEQSQQIDKKKKPENQKPDLSHKNLLEAFSDEDEDQDENENENENESDDEYSDGFEDFYSPKKDDKETKLAVNSVVAQQKKPDVVPALDLSKVSIEQGSSEKAKSKTISA